MNKDEYGKLALDVHRGWGAIMDELSDQSARVGTVVPVRDLPLIWWALRQANALGMVPGNRANVSRAMEHIWSQMDEDQQLHVHVMDMADLELKKVWEETSNGGLPASLDDTACPF